ncbi:unnamed protein product [Echinostoma caproni]|uniref:PMI_typeI_cat domain-containing protein n=1 Tax=Echinostoma caproni TaxID=27848 RepID=A0A183A279_9TREM|nr:unnamed protein product [Echinostoma caproni]
MLRLSCSYQTYDWGKLGHESEVYALLSGCTEEPVSGEDIPYAELWMGTHLSGPSNLYGNAKKSLATYLIEHPKCLGAALVKFGRTLPFLFKVLSVGKALSIQAHPNKVKCIDCFLFRHKFFLSSTIVVFRFPFLPKRYTPRDTQIHALLPRTSEDPNKFSIIRLLRSTNNARLIRTSLKIHFGPTWEINETNNPFTSVSSFKHTIPVI